nr:class I SAM-dependent methyltransferase [Actinomycetota bacterium]NIS36403.1 class I SAM-dependent methyltransferase [Actinomycetota bacterium]NIU70924.1 class I SAM-dependent methyltransferase [Actinomycetota bacterium]NIW32857.1 hypothetical protein [Actinomycetota bacterium]NIX25023.1 hypothetical protein [Actinomycetota bacterium]
MECPQCGKDVAVVPVPGAGRERFDLHDEDSGKPCWASYAWVDLATLDTENRFTDPTEACPHPERWTAADCQAPEHEVTALVAAFVTALRPDLVVETGTAWGQTAKAIGWALRGTGGVLHTVEPNPECCSQARWVCRDLPVKVHQTESLSFVPPGPVGFAWLDSLSDLRIPEVRHLLPHFTPGAIVGIHDTADHQGDLWAQVVAAEAEGLLLPIRLPTPRGVVFAE